MVDLINLTKIHLQNPRHLYLKDALMLLSDIQRLGMDPSNVDRLRKAITFYGTTKVESPYNSLLNLVHRHEFKSYNNPRVHPHMMRTRVSFGFLSRPVLVSCLIKRLGCGFELYQQGAIRNMILSTTRRVASRAIHGSLDTEAKRCLSGACRELMSVEMVWEFVQMGHGPTVYDLIWELIHGDCGIPQNISAAKNLTEAFPQHVSPGALSFLKENCVCSLNYDWQHFLEVCLQGKCRQTLYCYYIKQSRNDCEDDMVANMCLMKAATLGLADAQFVLAQKNWWKDRDFHQCIVLLQQAATQGFKYAQQLIETARNDIISFPQS